MPKVNKSAMSRTFGLLALLTSLMGMGLPGLAQGPIATKRSLVELRTRFGNMVVALYNETPELRDRFISRVLDHSLDSTLIHRVVPGFAIEAGDPGSRNANAGIPLGLDQDTVGFPVISFPGAIHRHGVLSASPAGDGPALAGRSHRDQFFIVLGVPYDEKELRSINDRRDHPIAYTEEDRRIYAAVGGTPHLDGQCTIFGEVIEGLEVLEVIAGAPCNTWDRPLEDIPMYTRLLP